MVDTNLSSFIWSVADLLRGDYRQSEYGRVILPFTVLSYAICKADRLIKGQDDKAGNIVLATKGKKEGTAGARCRSARYRERPVKGGRPGILRARVNIWAALVSAPLTKISDRWVRRRDRA